MDLMLICQGCLSQDRSLKPLGEFDKLFKAIFRQGFDVFQMGVRTSDLLLCWECLQIIKNIYKFHSKVVEAQLTLNNLIKQQSNNNDIKTLSSLSTTQITQNESVTAEQKLESLKEISILKVGETDSKAEVLKIPEISVEKTKQSNSHNKHKDETFDLNAVENLKEETDCDDNYNEHDDITDITIEPDKEIIEEKKLNITPQKRKPKPADQKKAVKKSHKTARRRFKYNTKYILMKDKYFYSILNLLNIVPGSLSENELERVRSEENPLKCTKCNEVCYNETDFTSHMKSHFQKYMCRLCGDDLTYDEDNIYKHIVLSRHKYMFDKIECSQRYCKMKFISVEERDKHSSECGIYKCNDCTEVFKSKKNIVKHSSKHMTFKCKDCNKTYITKRYRKHKCWKHTEMNTKMDLEAAYCVECNKQFNTVSLMRQHLKTSVKHRQEPIVRKTFPCSVCSKVLYSADTLRSHYDKTHVGITRYYCQPCDKYFCSNYRLQTHTQIVHDKIQPPKDKLCPHCGHAFRENSLQCTKCNEVCYNETDFTSHVKSHFQKYMCRLCGDDLTYDEDHIIRHVMLEHKNCIIKYKCTRKCCLKRFISMEEHDKHLTECGIYKCNDCTEVFKCKPSIATHCRKHMTYKCKHCNKNFRNSRALRHHKYVIHNKSEASYCVECDIQFGSIHAIQQHLKISLKHRNDSDVRKRYPCSECSKLFSSDLSRKLHYNKFHVGITEYHCQPCNKYFFDKYSLRLHSQIRHENKPPPKNKVCSYCGRGFRTNGILKNHIYIHTGERPHECSYCDAKFKLKHTRDMHMKNIHKHGINK